MRTIAIVLLASMTWACGNTQPDNRVDRRVKVPPAPANGIQYVLPEIEYAGYSEAMHCAYFKSPDHDVWVSAMEPFQNDGHHLVAFLSNTSLPDGDVRDCNDPGAMALWRPLAPSLGRFDLPEGYATKLPANSQIIFQIHYINYEEKPMVVRDVYHFEYTDKADPTPATTLASGTIEYELPPQQETSITYGCEIQAETNGFVLFGHMHEWGSKYSIDVLRAGATEPENIYDIPQWNADMRDTPPMLTWDPADPLALLPGDELLVNCSWMNNTDTAMVFPEEMCAAVLWYYPGEFPFICPGEIK